ncbi:MAG: ATP-binding protein [Pararhodobacter sp.]
MRNPLRPDGLSGRIALLLFLALAGAHLAVGAVLYLERSAQADVTLLDAELRRLGVLADALDGRASVERAAFADLAGNAMSDLSLSDLPEAGAHLGSLPDRLSRQIAAALPGRAVTGGTVTGPGESAPRLRLSIPLEPGGNAPEWLMASVRLDAEFRPPARVAHLVLIIGLPFTLVLAVGLLFVRRLVRPLQVMADAARAVGHGQRSMVLPEEGPRELRDVAAALNEMQERLTSAEAERLRMVAAVGHDLRTPITSLRIRAEMLDREEGGPIIRTLEDMTVMAESLIAYARGMRDAEPISDIDMAELLGRLCTDCGAKLSVKDAVLVRGQPVALGRALRNLLDNAARYGGGARVRLSRKAGMAEVQIDDDGPGIPPERREDLFRPFVRGEASRNTETGGAGLGLAIVRSVVERHGGRITLTNRDEGGLRATLLLLAQPALRAGSS